MCTPSGLRGAGTELAWVAAHVALYPLGITSERARERGREEAERFTLSDLPPVQRGLLMGDVVAAGTPIMLVHGLVDNRSIFTLLRRALRRRGFGRVLTLNYSPFTQDVRSAAARLERLVEKTCEETGYERVHVVGHSLGGVIARYYVQRMGGDARVHTLCTLGSPHAGTHAARLLPQRLVRQLRPGSPLMQELAAPVAGLPHPLRRLLERPRPDDRAEALRPDRPPRPVGAATCCCAASGTCRCPSTAASSTRSRRCWPTSTRTAARSRPASRRSTGVAVPPARAGPERRRTGTASTTA